MVILIGSKQDRVPEVQQKEQYSETASTSRFKKKKRRLKKKPEVTEAVTTKAPQVDSVGVQQSLDKQADVVVTSDPIPVLEGTESSAETVHSNEEVI